MLLRRVDAVEIGMGDRRAGDAHMHLAGARLIHHLHDLDRGGAAHDRSRRPARCACRAITLRLALCLSLTPSARICCVGSMKVRPDIVVADDAELEGDARGRGVAERRGHAGIGHRDHDVGLGRRFARQLGRPYSCGPRRRSARPTSTVGAREIDIFEDAGARRAAAGRGSAISIAVLGDHHHLAVLDLADEAGADDVERAGLRSKDIGAVELAEHQRPDAERIARADQLLVGEHHQRIGALELAERIDEAVDHARLLGAGDEMQDDLGVGGRLADRAVARPARAAASGRW